MRIGGFERLIFAPQCPLVKPIVHPLRLGLVRGSEMRGRQRGASELPRSAGKDRRILRTCSRKEGAVPKTMCSSGRKVNESTLLQQRQMTKEHIDGGLSDAETRISSESFCTWELAKAEKK